MWIPIPFVSKSNVLFQWFMGPQPHVRTVALHACYHWYILVRDCSLWLPIWQENSHNNNSNAHLCHFTCCSGVSILTALDVNSASGVVPSQWVLHHTCVIPRILQFCSVDLDSGVFPVGDNTHRAESGESWRGGNSMETHSMETWGVADSRANSSMATTCCFDRDTWSLNLRGKTANDKSNHVFCIICGCFSCQNYDTERRIYKILSLFCVVTWLCHH